MQPKATFYSYTFAENVWKSFKKKHTRAVEDLKNVSKLTDSMAIWFIRVNQDRWNSLKWCVKRVEKGNLAQVFLEMREMPKRVKFIKKIFQGTEYFCDKTGHFRDMCIHEYRYWKENTSEM